MVTNAQFPDKLDALQPVTQLYLSIDAATKESLKAIDRPLFSDFWERFIDSIQSLRKKGQRTVFRYPSCDLLFLQSVRLTLVKDYNMDNLKDYAELVRLGVPDFIEVKGVTYCGTSDARYVEDFAAYDFLSPLTIKNTPFQREVLNFCEALCGEVNGIVAPEDAVYEISCEHEHSLCVLISNKNKFFKDGKTKLGDNLVTLQKSGTPG
jgi:tRNA wybutosine-synthesizing protein 1